MLLELRKPDVGHYNNADHIEYHKSAYQVCDKYRTTIDATSLVVEYQNKVLQEDEIYKWVRHSEYTAKKAEADRSRDGIYTGITAKTVRRGRRR